MIELYTGTPGSGKSLHCAKVIYNKINHRKNVIANFDINMMAFKPKKRGKNGTFLYLDNLEISPNALIKFARDNHKKSSRGNITEGQTLLIIDECQILFNARDWQVRDRMQWASFFTQHRKYGYDIILITQFDRLVDRQIRCLVEYQVVHRKISNFKTIGFFLGLFFRGNVFVAVRQWYGVREKIDSEFFVLHKKYASLYDSYKIFNVQDDGGVGVPAADGAVNVVDSVVPKSQIDNIISTFKEVQNNIKNMVVSDVAPLPKYGCLSDFWNVSPPPN